MSRFRLGYTVGSLLCGNLDTLLSWCLTAQRLYFRHRNCFLSCFAVDGKDKHGYLYLILKFLVLLQITNFYIQPPGKCKKRMHYVVNYSGTKVCPMKIKVTQLPDGRHLSLFDTCMYLHQPHNSKGAFYVEVKVLH